MATKLQCSSGHGGAWLGASSQRGARSGCGASNLFIPLVQAARLAEARRAHLCGMAAKLAYENPLTIADAVSRWGFTFLTDQKVPCRFISVRD